MGRGPGWSNTTDIYSNFLEVVRKGGGGVDGETFT